MSRQVYFEHDNRLPTAPVYRPPGVMGRQMKFREYSKAYRKGKSRMVDVDGDVDMSVSHGSGAERRYNPYGSSSRNNNKRNKHGKKTGHKSKHNRNGQHSLESCVKLTIPFGKKLGKDYIYSTIKSNMEKNPFIPLNFRIEGNAAEFYVESYEAGREIRGLNRRFTTPDGFKMAIQMTKVNFRVPAPTLDAEVLELLKSYMSSRYDVNFHSLDLTKFHAEEKLKEVGLYVPLRERAIFNAVTKIIKEHIPQLETLILADNKLYTLEPLSVLCSTCKQLKVLSLLKNKIPSINELNHLKGLELTSLVLDNNPLCDAFRDRTEYISAVRDRFPKLLDLDGSVLPPPIGFDLGPETLPESKKSFLPDEVKELVIQFLDTYYSIYDSGDRSKLVDAYHDEASFSLSLSKNTSKNAGSISIYNMDNRNLLKVSDFGQRFQLLRKGKVEILTTLSDLPQTMHDPNTFSVDIFLVSPGLMSFSVIGIFKEVGVDIHNVTLKTFSRTFVVCPQGAGFVITNETLFIAHASQEQQSKAFKVPAPTPSQSPAPVVEERSAPEKQVLVVELSRQTGMNLDFSTKCLQENDWDFPRSLAVFQKFQSEGKLPPEAFITV